MAIQRKYNDLELSISYTSADYEAWTTFFHADSGRTYKVAPVIDVGILISPIDGVTKGTEVNHLNINARYASSTETARIFVGVWWSNTSAIGEVLNGARPWIIENAQNGQQYGPHALGSSWKGHRAVWVMVDITDGPVPVQNITFSCWVGYGTLYGHELDAAGEFNFAGVKFHYGISYPKNYDSEKANFYPLVLSTPGDGSQGCGDNKQFRYLTMLGSFLAGKWYHKPEYEAISVVYQMPASGCLSGADAPYTYDGWVQAQGSWLPAATREFIKHLLRHPDINVDRSKIYATGFSRGSLQTWTSALESADLLASIVTCFEHRSLDPRLFTNSWHGSAGLFFRFDEVMKQMRAIADTLYDMNIFRFHEYIYDSEIWPNGFEGTWIQMENDVLRMTGPASKVITECFTGTSHTSTMSVAYGQEIWMDQLFATRKTSMRTVPEIINEWKDDDTDAEKQLVAQYTLELMQNLEMAEQGDIDMDGRVDAKDLATVGKNWMKVTNQASSSSSSSQTSFSSSSSSQSHSSSSASGTSL